MTLLVFIVIVLIPLFLIIVVLLFSFRLLNFVSLLGLLIDIDSLIIVLCVGIVGGHCWALLLMVNSDVLLFPTLFYLFVILLLLVIVR